MPHLTWWDRHWRVAGDEFSVPALCSIAGRLSWTALITIILAVSYNSLASCQYGWIFISYLIVSIIVFTFSIYCDIWIMLVSLRGTIVEPEKRVSLGQLMSMRIGLVFSQLICAVFGIISLSRTAIPCNAEFENHALNRAFICIVVVSQMVDTLALGCCCYLFSANKIDENGEEIVPRESLALIAWEGRCRSIMRSIQVLSCNLFGGGNITEGFEEVAKVLTNFFHHDGFLDVVPSDVAAGIVLVRLEQRTGTRKVGGLQRYDSNPILSNSMKIATENLSSDKDSPNVRTQLVSIRKRSRGEGEGDVEQGGVQGVSESGQVITDYALVEDMNRCSIFALSMYTHFILIYMKPCSAFCRMSCVSGGCNNEKLFSPSRVGCGVLPCCCLSGGRSLLKRNEEIVVEGDNNCGLNYAGMRVITEALRQTEVLYASYVNDTTHKPFAVVLDHEKQLLVVAIRGTLSLEDCITDALCEPASMEAAGEQWGFDGRDRFAHDGMLKAALHIRGELDKSGVLHRVFPAGKTRGDMKTPLTENVNYSHYRLMITGHSLGAGTASILAVLLRNAYPTLTCITFGTPGSVFDKRSAREYAPFMTSVVLNNDIVSRLNFHSIHELRNQLLDVICRAKVNKMFIMQAIFKDFESEDLMHPPGQEPDSAFKQSIAKYKEVIQARLDRSDQPELCLPGRVVQFVKTSSERFCLMNYANYSLQEVPAENFKDIQVSTTMVMDHLPDRYTAEMQKVLASMEAARQSQGQSTPSPRIIQQA